MDVAAREDAVDIDIKGTIDFENVSFGYDETTDVLKKVNLHIEPGEMIGIVGKSGVGKSTQRSVILSFLLILVSGYVITRIFYR